MTIVELVSRWAAEKPDAPAYTFVDYQTDREGTRETLTWFEIDRRAKSVAAAIRQYAVPGDRVAILAPQGLDYLVGLLGSCYARTIAVPLFSPELPGHQQRLKSSLDNSKPACALTTAALRDAAEKVISPAIATDQVEPKNWQPERIKQGDIAYLQYTSGATGQPSGVMVTHGNLLANIEQLITAFRFEPAKSMTISWLPLWHDMGLMLAFGVPILHGDQSVFIDPTAFLMHPARWLKLARTPLDVYTAGPNFAYDYCAKRITEELDLSRVKVFLNGAEPIRPATITTFTETFGVAPETHTPAYGLAEAVVFVTSARVDAPPTIHAFDRDALSNGQLSPKGASGTVELVSVGPPAGQQLEIVGPDRRPCEPGAIGEVWLSGPNIAAGYWSDPERTAETFQATLADGTGPWLRTGDLGAWYDGELYLTGRLKDLIIVDGRNHYPQDIEATITTAHPHLKPGKVAAFSLPGNDSERLVIVVEGTAPDLSTIRATVKQHHDLRVHELIHAPAGTIRRTSSGKLARQATRDWFLLNH